MPPSDAAPSPARFVVLVPVKPPVAGKSRLQGVDDGARTALAAAFARDTVAACLAAEQVAAVLVATDDAVLALALGAAGATCLPDGATGLNETLVQSAAEAARRWPDLVPVALPADLPGLEPGDLDAALAASHGALPASGHAFVPDAAGLGTTLYTAEPSAFAPRFGEGSAAAHAAAGAVDLTRTCHAPLGSLRRDVDDLVDLATAASFGVGPHTRAVLDDLGLF
ncbi:2-phospho-L-lactate guanylyltransferase [Nocardioides bruguierae]|uniref:2-phospho-L-lactate guanylyltransferase n=1 Tax=Nocardioides bruguierae TaxID=2945102 RepID=A0A9X2D623_9ACTN|nr:2-phospho-L-lactate guanylyltransferase [Nocardioides bruguierae]MCM0619684.1 2-phospho-L-lactate guanylyltransferase [Nocardioides bruguierae]